MLGAVSPWAIRLKLEQHRGLGRDRRPHVRDLDRRLAARHVPLRAAADPARRHAAHVPRLRARAGARRRARARRAAGGSSPLGVAALFAVPVGTVKAAEDGQGDPRDRHDVPVRARHRPPQRRPHARAQRGPGDPLALPPRHACSPAATGTATCVTPFTHPPRPAAPDRDPRLRRRHHRPRLRALLPEHDHRRRRDRRRAVRHRPPLLRPRASARSCASTPRTRARSCATPTARYDSIFLDTYRQPYIPFYLSTHEFFELVRDRLAPGGSVIVNLGHPEGHDELEKVLTATMGARLRRTSCATRSSRPTRC